MELDGSVGPGRDVVLEEAARERWCHAARERADRIIEYLGGYGRLDELVERAGEVRVVLGAIGEGDRVEATQREVDGKVGAQAAWRRQIRCEVPGRVADAHAAGQLTRLGADAKRNVDVAAR